MAQVCAEVRVLVVEDSPMATKLVERALGEAPYELRLAREGREALKAMAGETIDIVITDWELPDTTGPELCRKIRSKFGAAPYIVMLTSHADDARVAEALAAGADDYLTKPFEREEFRARVGVGRRVLEMRREIEGVSRRLSSEARSDPVTRLPNRAAVEEWAAKQLAGAARHGYPFLVIAVELDSYEPVSHTFGSAAGEAMLQAFAEVLKKETRSSDLCGHVGGKGFVMAISHVEKKNVPVVIERLRMKVAAKDFTFSGATLPLAASFGAATAEGREAAEFGALLEKARAALRETRSSLRVSSVRR